MRTNYGVINNPVEMCMMIKGVSYLVYVTKNGNTICQGYYIEKSTKDIKNAKRKLRKIVETDPNFLHWD